MSSQAEEASPERSSGEGLGLRTQHEAEPELSSNSSGPARPFHLPSSSDPAPPTGKLVAMCAWATGLGLVALLVAAQAVVATWRGDEPGWYEPALIAVGLAGLGLTVGAFMSIQRRRLPWIMLALATITLVASIVLTVRAI